MVGTRSQRIPLSSLTALTLHKDRRTAARRIAPVPQLTCRGSACRVYQPEVVQCVAVGSDGVGGLEWKCEADLPRGLRFGEVQVGCEGWDGPDDPFILRGSCGLEYSLVRASSALEDADGGGLFPARGMLPTSLHPYLPRSTGAWFNSTFNLVFAALTVYLVWGFLRKLFRPVARRLFPAGGAAGGGGAGGGGGGAGGGPFHRPTRRPGDSPPPPYTPKPATVPSNDPSGATAWRPGFWTGAAAGWAANALMGAARPSRERVEPLDYGAAFGQGRSFWGGGAAPERRRGWGAGPGGFGMGGGGAGPRRFDDEDDRGVGGSGMRRSAGFGGTSVR